MRPIVVRRDCWLIILKPCSLFVSPVVWHSFKVGARPKGFSCSVVKTHHTILCVADPRNGTLLHWLAHS